MYEYAPVLLLTVTPVSAVAPETAEQDGLPVSLLYVYGAVPPVGASSVAALPFCVPLPAVGVCAGGVLTVSGVPAVTLTV